MTYYLLSLETFKHSIDSLELKLDMVIQGPEWNDPLRCEIISANERKILEKYYLFLTDEKVVENLGPWYKEHIDFFKNHRKKYFENIRDTMVKFNEFWANKIPLARALMVIIKGKGDSIEKSAPSHMDDFKPAHTMNNFLKILEIAKKNNIHMAITTAPDDFEDYSTPLSTSCRIINTIHDLYRYTRISLNPHIIKFAMENDAILIDLAKRFNSESDKKKLFEPLEEDKNFGGFNGGDYMHFNYKGHEIVAETIAETLWPYLKDLP